MKVRIAVLWPEMLTKNCRPTRSVARTLIVCVEGGGVFIYSGSAQLVSFEIKLISKGVSQA